MIQRLYIKDFAIIDEINLDLKPGFTVITGETGSGKSILLKALSVSLGAKADKVMVRNGSNRAIIETEFNENVFRRLISNNGRTKAYCNNEPITINDLIKANETSVDFHGQHDQQLIMEPNRHIDYLDRYCRHEKDVLKIGELFQELTSLRAQLNHARQSADERRDRLELLKFQANEIDSADPIIGEDFELDKKYKKLSHLEDIIKTLQIVHDQVNTSDNSVIDLLEKNLRSIDSIAVYDEELNKISELFKTSIIQLQEGGVEISNRLSGLEFNPGELLEVGDRLQAIEGLKRKYGGSMESILEKRNEIQVEVNSLTKPELSEDEILRQIHIKVNDYSELAIQLYHSRKKNANLLSRKIEESMATLNMPGAIFDIKITQKKTGNSFVLINGEKVDGNVKGIDMIEFFLSANPGEVVKPLASIASGGEISRIMLAIKTVFQDLDPVQTLVFDEIDSGISGKAAEKVADLLLKLSKSKQVFCITHLSQIAIRANHHLHIVKSIKNDQTIVEMKYLSEKESPKVINELFVGKNVMSV